MNEPKEQAMQCKNEGDTLYREKKYQIAIMKYTQAINLLHPQGLTPSDESTFQTLYVSYSNRCACFLQINRVDQALADAKQCVKLKPDWSKGYIRLGSCYHRLNKLSDAIAAYEQVIAIDATNQEARQSIQRIRNQQNQPSFSSSSTNTGSQSQSNNHQFTQETDGPQPLGPPSFLHQIQEYLQSIPWQTYWRNMQLQFNRLYVQFMTWWVTLSPDTQKYIQIGTGILIVYYFFIYRGSSGGYSSGYNDYGSSSPHGHHYQPQPGYGYYNNNYGYSYSSGGGLSWMTWGLIMFGAYKLPPMFEEQLGPIYGRPFFGMNWTTFMWLLNMLTRNNAHMPFVGGGGFGRPMFGGRRRY